ncbi:MAG TPA: hypothetical protein VJJ24_02930 [Candidatus Paceibacterota bacterium]
MKKSIRQSGSANGPLVGTIVIVILLVLGAFYVFMQKRADDTNNPESASVESSDENIDNEALTIEAELTAQEKEMDSLEAELEATQ